MHASNQIFMSIENSQVFIIYFCALYETLPVCGVATKYDIEPTKTM